MPTADFNLYAHFRTQFQRHAKDVLLHTGDDLSLSYADVDRRSAAIASLLSGLGIEPGDRVSVQVEKSPEALCLYLACLRGGFIFHPLNLAYTTSELEYFLNNAEPAAVICDPDREVAIKELAHSAGAQVVLTLAADGKGTLADGADSAPDDFDIIYRDADDMAALLYSSGTTGVPKGIMLTHSNLLRNTEALVEAWGFTSKDRLLHALPIFHVHGLFVAIGCTLLSGASMRWLRNYDVREVMRFLPECSVLMGVPTYYTRLLAETSLDASVCSSMRLFVSGSAPLLEETFEIFRDSTRPINFHILP